MSNNENKRVSITQVRSSIKQSKKRIAILKILRLGRIGRVAEFDITPSIAGQIEQVKHLVKIEQV